MKKRKKDMGDTSERLRRRQGNARPNCGVDVDGMEFAKAGAAILEPSGAVIHHAIRPSICKEVTVGSNSTQSGRNARTHDLNQNAKENGKRKGEIDWAVKMRRVVCMF